MNDKYANLLFRMSHSLIQKWMSR